MAFPKSKVLRVLIALVLLVSAPLVWWFGQDIYWRIYPEAAFESVTGRSLPPGVKAVAYIGRMEDALFHTTHYWRLTGSVPDLRQVIAGTGFVRQDDVAVSVYRMARKFGLERSPSKVAEAYELDEMRFRFYCILGDSNEAFYSH